MQEISTTTKSLPQTLEEKTKYVLFGTEALKIYRAKLKAMEKAGISKEQYEQLKMEAQETAENLLLFSADIGKEMSQIEQTKGNRYSLPSTSGSTKSQAIHNMGFTDRQARDFQTLAKHPEVINKAIEDARAEDRIVTKSDVLNRIAPPKSQAQVMREFKEQAREEHEAFREKTKESIVDFEDIRKDQTNAQVVISETRQVFSRAFRSVTEIGFLKQKDVDEMIKSLDEADINLMKDEAATSIRILEHLINKLGGKNG